MGRAFVEGLLKAKLWEPAQVWISDVRSEVVSSLRRSYGVSGGTDNRAAVKSARTVVLCVKPQQMAALLEEVVPVMGRKLVLSIAAGLTTRFFESRLPSAAVIRVMPNTPALVGEGALVFCRGRRVTPTQVRQAENLLGSLGEVWELPEKLMDAVTALSGSGPAYLFYLVEVLSKAGVAAGLPREIAAPLARQTVWGAGALLKARPDVQPEDLRRQVTSPGGTTEAALDVLQSSSLQKIFDRALVRARKRSRELSQR